jgi:hypothetical protein
MLAYLCLFKVYAASLTKILGISIVIFNQGAGYDIVLFSIDTFA